MALLLKRFVCPRCGATGPLPSSSPFLHCEACGSITDFDWGVARRCPDWPRHEALSYELFNRHKPQFESAGKRQDRVAWTMVYAEILRELVDTCSAVYPLRVAEPAYRAHFVEFQAAHNAGLVFDPELVAGQREINQRAYRNLQREGAIFPLDKLWPVVERSLRHFDAQDRICGATPPGPPEDFVPGYMRRIGISMTVQEWLPLLSPADQRELVTRMGVSNEYVEPEATANLRCGGCGADIPPTGEPTATCGACRATVDVARGAVACRNCGAAVHLVVRAEQAACPYCRAEIHESRAGIVSHGRTQAQFEFLDGELAISVKDHPQVALRSIEVLDGEVTRPATTTGVAEGKWRAITVRTCFADDTKEDIFESLYAYGASENDDVYSWLDLIARNREIPSERRAYREHARCIWLPRDDADLDRRLAEAAPEVRRSQIVAIRHGRGFVWEVMVGDTVVRLAIDEEGKRTKMIRAWIARGP